MIVRLATTDDVERVQSAAHLERDAILSRDAAIRLVENPANRVVLAIEGAMVVGCLVAYLLDRLDGNAMAMIYHVFVDERFRRQGIGSEMMAVLLENVRAAGVCKAWVFTGRDNLPAHRLYESQGGVIDDNQRLYWYAGR